MKNIIYLFIYLLTSSCNAQNIVIDVAKKDVVLFNFSKKNISLSKDIASYRTENFSIAINNRYLIGSRYGKFNYTLIKSEKDTMNIKCYCGQEANIYIKNLKFKKGNYNLSFNFPRIYNEKTKKYEKDKILILGKEIKTTKETQNIVFKNAVYTPLEKKIFKDVYFKNLKFIVIDLKDTTNVKLEQIR